MTDRHMKQLREEIFAVNAHKHKWVLAEYNYPAISIVPLVQNPRATFVCTNQPCKAREVIEYNE